MAKHNLMYTHDKEGHVIIKYKGEYYGFPGNVRETNWEYVKKYGIDSHCVPSLFFEPNEHTEWKEL